MKRQDMTLDEAIFHVKLRRPQIAPNPGFMKQLLQFQHEVCILSGELEYCSYNYYSSR
jgi:hypothetical protein